MKRQWYEIGIVVALSFAHINCSGTHKKKSFAAPEPEVAPAYLAADSFTVKTSGRAQSPKYEIGINQDALNKEFLLQGALIDQTGVPQFNGIRSRIVAFRQVGDQLFMLEATKGHVVTDELPKELILAQFPITNDAGTIIYFDFNAGMSNIMMAADWYASDTDGKEDKDSWNHLKLDTSYVAYAEVQNDHNMLLVRQVGQAVQAGKNGSEEEGVLKRTAIKAQYYLSPYNPDPDFVPTRTFGHDQFGFFEVAPQMQINTDTTAIYGAKFDSNKPIVYAISDNTPAEYRQPIRDAVLYWNQAFGREVVQVIDAPAGRRAPDVEYNIIQWVTWDDAGYAYADAQMDPRTGQVLHAQVFMTSAFAVGGRDKAKLMLAELDQNQFHALKQVGLRGLTQKPLCDRHMEQHQVTALSKMLANGASDAEILQVSQDYVREVVAHEVGHTLGLRHNFAGSLGANYNIEDRDQLVKDYFANTLPTDLITSSSVMEYQLFEESMMTGRQIASTKKALPYDSMAIRALYNQEKFTKKDTPLFCTDSHVEKFLDCRTFDASSSLIKSRAADAEDSLKSLPSTLLMKYEQKKVAKDADKADMNIPAISVDELATKLLTSRAEVVEFLRADRAWFQVRHNYAMVDAVNMDEVIVQERAKLDDAITSAGGFKKIFAPLPQSTIDQVKIETNALIQASTVLSAEDKLIILPYVEQLFNKLPNAMAKMQLTILSAGEQIISAPVTDSYVDYLLDTMTYYVLATKGTENVKIRINGAEKEIPLPQYLFPYEYRTLAVTLLNSKGATADFALMERLKFQALMGSHMKAVLGVDNIDDLDMTQFPRNVARWYSENYALIKSL